MDNFQIHVFRISILMKKIQLSVRFQCSLSFQLKADSITSENLKHYNITKGQCIINQAVSIQAQINFNISTQKYEDKKIIVTVYMNNANRKVPGGTVHLTITNEQLTKNIQKTSALQKCPDKAAKIIFTQSAQFLRKIDNNSSKITNKYGNNTSKALNVLSTPYRQKLDMPFNSERKQSKNKSSYGAQMVLSQKKIYQPYASKISFNNDQKQKNSYQQQKYFQLEREKLQLVKQLAKKNNEIDQLNHKLHSKQTQEQLQQITHKFQKAKQNLRINERKQRQSNMIIKQLRQQLSQKKNKIRILQQLMNDKQLQLTQKEKYNKDLQVTKKKLEQKIEDLNLQIMSSIKRVELKEQSFKEQVKRLSEKYSQCQNQRSQSMESLNKILQEMQNLQKKNQLSLKEKDRSFYEEKIRFQQQIQQLNKKVAQLEEQIQDKNGQLIQFNQLKKKTHLSQQEKTQEIVQLAQAFQKQKNKLNKQIEIRKILQSQNASLKIIEEERNLLKKKFTEQSNQLIKAKDKINEISLKLNNQTQKNKKLEENFKNKNDEKLELENKLINIIKEVQKHKKNEERQTREAQTISIQNSNYNQKLLELKDKLHLEMERNNAMQMQFNDQLTYLNNTKQNLQSQLDEARWQLEKVKQTNQSLLQKLKILNEQKLKVHKQNIENSQKTKKMLEQVNQLKLQKQNLQNRIKNMSEKQKQSYSSLQEKFNDIFQKDKKIHYLQSQMSKLNSKVKNYEMMYQDKLGTQESLAKEKEMLALQKTEELGQLQLEVLRKNQQIFLKDQNIALKEHELQLLQQQINDMKSSSINYQQKIQQLRLQLQMNMEKNNQLTNNLAEINQTLNASKLSFKKLKNQFEQFKQANSQAFSKFAEQISTDQQSYVNPNKIIAFPDLNLCMLQIDAIKKKNNIIKNYKDQLKSMTDEKQISQSNLKKYSQLFSQRESQLEKEVQRLKNKIEQQINNNSESKHEHFLSDQVNEERINQYIAQIQKFNQQNSQYREAIQAWKFQNQKLSAQCIENCNQLKLCEDQINRLNTELQKIKATHQNKLSSITDMSISFEEKSKIAILQLQKKVNTLQSTIENRQQTIQTLLKENSGLTYNIDKQTQLIEQQKQKIQALMTNLKRLQNQKKINEKNIKQLTENQQRLQRIIQQQQLQNIKIQKKATMYSQQNNLTKAKLGKQQVRVKQLEQELEQLISRINQKNAGGKLFNDKYTSQINSFQQKIANLKAQLQLKEFENKQQMTNVKRLNEIIQQLQKNLQKKKADMLKIQSKNQQLTQQLLKYKQYQEITSQQKQSLSKNQHISQQKDAQLLLLKAEHQANLNLLQSKQQDLIKTKKQLQNCLLLLDKSTVDLKSSKADTKRQLWTKNSKQQQLRKYVRQLENQLEEKEQIIYSLQRQLLTQQGKDKKESELEVKNFQNKMQELKRDYQRQINVLNRRIDQLSTQLMQLQGNQLEKLEIIQTQAIQLKQYEKRIDDLTNQLKDCIQIWDREKSSMKSSKKQQSSGKEYARAPNEIGYSNKYGELSQGKKVVDSLSSSEINLDQKSNKQVANETSSKYPKRNMVTHLSSAR